VNPDPPHDFEASWGFIQWAVGAALTGCMTVAGFVWRLSNRVEMLEREQVLREKADDARHAENIHVMRGLQQQMSGIIIRIDQIYRTFATRGPRED
jgi:hypothetical protein